MKSMKETKSTPTKVASLESDFQWRLFGITKDFVFICGHQMSCDMQGRL